MFLSVGVATLRIDVIGRTSNSNPMTAWARKDEQKRRRGGGGGRSTIFPYASGLKINLNKSVLFPLKDSSLTEINGISDGGKSYIFGSVY